jgi:hypothetical protein
MNLRKVTASVRFFGVWAVLLPPDHDFEAYKVGTSNVPFAKRDFPIFRVPVSGDQVGASPPTTRGEPPFA